MTTDRKKPGMAFWATVVVVVVLVAYPLSFGPACWWFSRENRIHAYFGPSPVPKQRLAPHLYWPIGWLATNGPRSIRRAIFWYAMLGASPERCDEICLPIDKEGVEYYPSGLVDLEDLIKSPTNVWPIR